MSQSSPTNEIPTDPAPAFVPDPSRPALVMLADEGFESEAGFIDNLRHHGVTGTVSVLEGRVGTHRARHFHKEDEHWLYVALGCVQYYERPIGSTEAPEPQHFYEREMFYTPPMVEHELRFPVYTLLVSISSRTRTHDEHESDVVRVDFKLPGE